LRPDAERTRWPIRGESGILSPSCTRARATLRRSRAPPFDDLDLDRPEDEEEWDRAVAIARDTQHCEAKAIVIVSVLRIDAAKSQVVRNLAPIAIGAGVVARHLRQPVLTVSVFAAYAAVMIVLWKARRSFGQREITITGSRLTLGDKGPQIEAADVSRWTLWKSTARLYGSEATWRLRAVHQDGLLLESTLGRIFGPAAVLQQRGSRQARALSLVVSLSGVALVALGIAWDEAPLELGGALCSFLGLVALAVLSEKVVKDRSPGAGESSERPPM
jgi:hypothetical protein